MILVAAIVVVGLGYAALKRGLNAPEWLIAQFEERLNASVVEGILEIDGVRIELLDGLAPDIVLTNVRYLDDGGHLLAQVDRVHTVFAKSPILSPQLLPRRVALSGAQIALRRDKDGALNLQFGGANSIASSGDLNQIILDIKSLFENPFLSKTQDVSVVDLDLQLVDDYNSRTWMVSEAALVMNFGGGQIDVISSFAVSGEQGEPAQVAVSLSAPKTGLAAQVTVNVDGIDANDVAIQSPALAWLGVLAAPISGALRTEIRADGSLGDLNGTLEIGSGALQPTDEALPIQFSEAKTYFSYDPVLAKIRFDLIDVKSETAEVTAQGFAYLQDWNGARPETLVTQLQFSKLVTNPGNHLPTPAVFDGGALDFRLRLDPFEATIGQLSLIQGARRMLFDGKISAPEGDWDLVLNTSLNTIDHDSLLALWPVRVAPRTRKWLNENVSGGQIYNVVAAIRKSPGKTIRASLGYEFRDATVRYLKKFPPVLNGNGYVSFSDRTMTISVNEGQVDVPNSETLDVSGTVVTMPDVTLRPSPMEVVMKVKGNIPSVLSLLDLEPFSLVSKAGQTVDIAQGKADVIAKFGFDIVKKVKQKDISFDVQGKLLDVTSTHIVPSKILTSKQLDLLVSQEGMRISGAGRVGNESADVPFNVIWKQPFGKERKGNPRATGDIELSQDFIRAFDLGLPNDMLSGEGVARIEIDMPKNAAPRFSLTSDMNRLGVKLAGAGWSSPKNATGSLAITGELGKPARIDNFELSVSGLSASGSIDMASGGGLKNARFRRFRIGDGLDLQAKVIGRGKGVPPEISIAGGVIDLRRFTLPKSKSNASGARQNALSLNLDRLVVLDSLSLTNFRGDFSSGAGFKGTFTANVNGGAAVSGTVAPIKQGGSAIRLRSPDAGAVLKAAGLFKDAHKGELSLVLAPRGKSGHYSGRLTASNVRVKNASAMAEILSAMSVVGLLEQLQDSGILFNEVTSDFTLSPERLTLLKSSAIGASMGISLSGAYDFSSKQIALKGVLSPFYLLNGIGSIFTRKGEGLFGFNFSVRGTTDAPVTRVNPFSLLTPGMFREIFDAPPPKTQ